METIKKIFLFFGLLAWATYLVSLIYLFMLILSRKDLVSALLETGFILICSILIFRFFCLFNEKVAFIVFGIAFAYGMTTTIYEKTLLSGPVKVHIVKWAETTTDINGDLYIGENLSKNCDINSKISILKERFEDNAKFYDTEETWYDFVKSFQDPSNKKHPWPTAWSNKSNGQKSSLSAYSSSD